MLKFKILKMRQQELLHFLDIVLSVSRAEKQRQVEHLETVQDFILDLRNSWKGLPQSGSEIELFDSESDFDEFSGNS